MEFFKKSFLITGGTGSFGNAVIKKLLNENVKEIRIFSRDEKKQDDMREKFKDSRIKFYLGDVRDPYSVLRVVEGMDYIFHAAALKQVPSCEFHPLEAVKTNIIGTENIIDAAIRMSVKKIVCLSTDKAVYPINAMGMSKALMEKIAIAKARQSLKTTICITRYGNVMASRGSVIPLFINQIKSGVAISITDPNMTRFMMSLDEAVKLVLYAFNNGKNGDIYVQKAPAATIKTLTKSISKLLGFDEYPINVIGFRHGEKLFEVLLSKEERSCSVDLGDYFSIPMDGRDLNYNIYIDKGNKKTFASEEYNSHNTRRLDENEMSKMILDLNIL